MRPRITAPIAPNSIGTHASRKIGFSSSQPSFPKYTGPHMSVKRPTKVAAQTRSVVAAANAVQLGNSSFAGASFVMGQLQRNSTSNDLIVTRSRVRFLFWLHDRGHSCRERRPFPKSARATLCCQQSLKSAEWLSHCLQNRGPYLAGRCCNSWLAIQRCDESTVSVVITTPTATSPVLSRRREVRRAGGTVSRDACG